MPVPAHKKRAVSIPNLLDAGYLTALTAAAPWLAWRSMRTGRYRQDWRARWAGTRQFNDSLVDRVWLHGVSVGEVNLLPGLVGHWQQQEPSARFVISSTTDTGLSLARRYFSDEVVFRCPLDFSWAVQRTLSKLEPRLLVLAELELWPNLIRSATAMKIPVAVVNARLSERSFRGYWRVRALLRTSFSRLSLVCAQTPEYAERFVALGAPHSRVFTTGCLKFDDARTERTDPEIALRRKWIGSKPEHRVWLAGSTQAPEEEMALQSYMNLRAAHPELRLALVPRHPERGDEVANLIRRFGLNVVRRSQTPPPADTPWNQQTVALIDTVGELKWWWGLSDIAFVGGSMGSRGGQNMLEPAGFGAAVATGPNTVNFRDIVQLLREGDGLVIVADQPSMEAFVRRALIDRDWAEQLGGRAQRIVISHRGATSRTVERLLDVMRPASRQAA